jgi:hypothetical protein
VDHSYFEGVTVDSAFVTAVETSRAAAPRPTGRVMDMTGKDYSFEPERGGVAGRVATWSVYSKSDFPCEGDQLLLRNGERSSRYRVVEVNFCRDVDPPTMWIAHVIFDPRA